MSSVSEVLVVYLNIRPNYIYNQTNADGVPIIVRHNLNLYLCLGHFNHVNPLAEFQQRNWRSD